MRIYYPANLPETLEESMYRSLIQRKEVEMVLLTSGQSLLIQSGCQPNGCTRAGKFSPFYYGGALLAGRFYFKRSRK